MQDADAMQRAITIVKKHGMKRGVRPLVVLSACAGVTNGLIRIGELSLLGKIDQAHKAISDLDQRHFGILHDLHLSLRSEQEASLALRYIWRELRTIVRGVELLAELTPKMKDNYFLQANVHLLLSFPMLCGKIYLKKVYLFISLMHENFF